MFYVPRDFGSTTSNISYCSGAPAEAGNCAAEAHSAHIIVHSFTVRNANFALAEAGREESLTAATKRSAACGGFLSVKSSERKDVVPIIKETAHYLEPELLKAGCCEQIVIPMPYPYSPPGALYQYRWFTRPALRGTSSMARRPCGPHCDRSA